MNVPRGILCFLILRLLALALLYDVYQRLHQPHRKFGVACSDIPRYKFAFDGPFEYVEEPRFPFALEDSLGTITLHYSDFIPQALKGFLQKFARDLRSCQAAIAWISGLLGRHLAGFLTSAGFSSKCSTGTDPV